jgi:hypothetical protein
LPVSAWATASWSVFYNGFQKLRGGKPYPEVFGKIPDGTSTPAETLDLQPGEWVQVKSPQEIGATITTSGFNRGMRYDMEMAKYTGERYRVQMRSTNSSTKRTARWDG